MDYSVGGQTEVWIRGADWARLMPIEEACHLSGDDYQTIAVNPATLELEWRPVTGRFRHDSGKKRCFAVQLERDQEISITEDHSLFTIDPMTAQIAAVKGSHITIGTPIVVPCDLFAVTDAWDSDIESPDLANIARFCRESSRPWSIRGENGHVTDRLRRTRLPFLRVVDITETRSTWMYDLSVEGAENFVANGILAHNSGYPDCRPEYYEAFQEVARLGTKRGVEGDVIEIRTPLIRMTKGEIVRRGAGLGVPFELTWSCYHGRVKACGVCDACQLRLKGFQEADMTDPIEYETVA
ncbi:MAG: 7-cyano-7-deazaguanine synthase [Thermoplasmata archaeon]